MQIDCPGIDVGAGLGVRNEVLSNRLGEKMWIVVGEEQDNPFETVAVDRVPSG